MAAHAHAFVAALPRRDGAVYVLGVDQFVARFLRPEVGFAQLVGIASLYRALSIGTMSVISPVSASGAAALPVIVGVATGERPEALQYAGMAAAFVGVVLATRAPGDGDGSGSPREALWLSGLAAIGFGGFFIGMDYAIEDSSPYWALLVARTTAVVVLGDLDARRGRRRGDSSGG